MCLTLGVMFVSASLWAQPTRLVHHGILLARILEWVAIPFSGDFPDPRIEPRSSALQADSLLSEPSGKPITLRM